MIISLIKTGKLRFKPVLKTTTLLVVLFLWILHPSINASETTIRQESNMIALRKANERGMSNISWLKSAFTFSFADYYDAKHTGFRALRVINEDKIKGGKGFDSHPHKNMEIITYVIDGAIQHKDSIGNTSIIRPGEVQRMRAGTGVVHSEYNHEKEKETHLYQIWITPIKNGSKPSYEQKSFETAFNQHKMVLVISQDGRDGSIHIDQDADLYVSRFSKGEKTQFTIKPNRYVWIQMIKGKMTVNGQEMMAGDGLSTKDGKSWILDFTGLEDGEFMLFDLA